MKIVSHSEIGPFLFTIHSKEKWHDHEKNLSKEVLRDFMYTSDSRWGLPFTGFGKCEQYGYFICVPQEDGINVNIIWAEKEE